METFTEDTLEFREARIVGGDKGDGGGPNGIRKEGTGNLFYEGWGITSGEEGLGEVGG